MFVHPFELPHNLWWSFACIYFGWKCYCTIPFSFIHLLCPTFSLDNSFIREDFASLSTGNYDKSLSSCKCLKTQPIVTSVHFKKAIGSLLNNHLQFIILILYQGLLVLSPQIWRNYSHLASIEKLKSWSLIYIIVSSSL
jgi:hypothetical protein